MSDRSPEASQQVVGGALQQVAIDRVYDRFRGQPADVVAPALRDALVAAGLACPPAPWLMAVAAEISAGRVYVVGNGLVTDDPFGNSAAGPEPPGEPAGADEPVGNPDALWFSTDPKISHHNPADSVEHPESEPVAVEELRHSVPEDMPTRGDVGPV